MHRDLLFAATRDSVEAIVTAPVRAGEAVSGAINGVGKAFTAVKDKAYGVGDAFAGLASVPAALSAKREREQKVLKITLCRNPWNYRWQGLSI